MDTVSFKLSPELNAKLEYFAALDERPKSYLIRKAVEDFIADMEEDEADYKAAMEVLNDPSEGPAVPWEEVRKELGLDRRD
jgi:predicted transcriptional regulator